MQNLGGGCYLISTYLSLPVNENNCSEDTATDYFGKTAWKNKQRSHSMNVYPSKPLRCLLLVQWLGAWGWTFPPTAFRTPPVPSLSITVPPYNLPGHIFHLEHEVLKIRSSNSGQHLIYDWNKNLSGQFLMLMERQQILHSGRVAIWTVACWFYPQEQSWGEKFNELWSWTDCLMFVDF